jgi:hypothetical protein
MCSQSLSCVHKPHSNLYSPYIQFKAVFDAQNQLFLLFLCFPNFPLVFASPWYANRKFKTAWPKASLSATVSKQLPFCKALTKLVYL